MVFFFVLFHGLKLGFEYLPTLGTKGSWVLEIAFIRFVLINGVEHEPSDVQDSD